MPGTLLAEATLTGAVTGTTASLATLTGQVGAATNHVNGTVSRALVDSYDGTALLYGVTATLEGVDVTGDLIGPVTVSSSIDSPFTRATITLEGSQYSPLVTEDTWTQVGDVTLTWLQGPAGGVRTETRFVGKVESVSNAGREQYALSLVDQSHKYNQTDVCYELAPLAGLTRGQIAGQLCQAAGLSSYSIPPGQTYTKAVSGASRKLFDILADLGAPEGWSWRTGTDGILEAYVPLMKLPPEAPDYVWDLGDLLAPASVDPPKDVPDRWVVRGLGAVELDELGQETETVEYEIYETASLDVAVSEQDTSGTITSTGETSAEATRLTQRIEVKTTKLAGLVIRKETTQWSFYNPRVGKWDTSRGGSPGGGTADDGYYYLEAYLDTDGNYVQWLVPRFVRTGRRVEEYAYDVNSNLTQQTVDTYGWYSIRRATRVGGGATTPTVSNSVVGDDDVSYKSFGGASKKLIEEFGLQSSVVISYTYDTDTGAVVQEQTSTYRYEPIRSRVDTASYYVNADGSGQWTELEVSWRLAEREIKSTFLDDSGRLAGDQTTQFGYVVTELPDGVGTYDWGSFSSFQDVARFAIANREIRQIDIESEDSYTEIEYGSDGTRQETRRLGSVPLPRYETSAYTRLVQRPIEVEWESDVLTTWFGPRTQVISHDWLQTEDEARNMLARLRSRALSHQVRVARPETLAEPGDTVLLTDREQGLAHRALVVDVTRVRDLSTPSCTAQYTLEIPLLPWEGPL